MKGVRVARAAVLLGALLWAFFPDLAPLWAIVMLVAMVVVVVLQSDDWGI